MPTYIEMMEERQSLTEQITAEKKQLEEHEARLIALEEEIAQEEADYQDKRREHRRQMLMRVD